MFTMNATSSDQHQRRSIDVIEVLKTTGDQGTLLSILVGGFIIIINSVQLWFLKTKFRREVNPLFVVITHLCFTDLLNGLVSVVFVYRWKGKEKSNTIVKHFAIFFSSGDKVFFILSVGKV